MVSATVKDNWLFIFQVLVYFHKATNCWLKTFCREKGKLATQKKGIKKLELIWMYIASMRCKYA